jgi:hypothetical protein
MLVQQGPPQYRGRTTCLLARLTQLHGTEQLQEKGDSVQRVADELLDETAGKQLYTSRDGQSLNHSSAAYMPTLYSRLLLQTVTAYVRYQVLMEAR